MGDLRTPCGLFFTALGLIVSAVGILFPGMRAPLTEANVNLYGGIAMLVFGGVMLWLGRRSA
jgi:hypothetical protein